MNAVPMILGAIVLVMGALLWREREASRRAAEMQRAALEALRSGPNLRMVEVVGATMTNVGDLLIQMTDKAMCVSDEAREGVRMRLELTAMEHQLEMARRELGRKTVPVPHRENGAVEVTRFADSPGSSL
jgi:hypothetical protein